MDANKQDQGREDQPREDQRKDDQGIDRRDLLRLGAITGAALTGMGLTGCQTGRGQKPGSSADSRPDSRPDTRPDTHPAPKEPFRTPPMERVRVGAIGVGGMGSNHVRQLCKLDGVEVKAICDINERNANRAQRIVERAGQERPKAYMRGERDYERMCAEEELDLIYIATPWRWHVPMAVAAMKAGKHAAIEVPAAITVEGCWELVETAEALGKHCVMLENCCYDRPEMQCLNMVRQGLLGEVLHGECGYAHDLRGIKFSRRGEGLWRRAHSEKRNGNLYPTHGVGPVAQCMNVNRGDRLDYLVSMSGPSRGLQLWQEERLREDDPRRKEKYVLGDVNLTLIKTAHGKTIYVVHDTNLPRPYSRLHTVQGTRGVFQRWPSRVHVEGKSRGHRWQELKDYEEYEHPLWKSDAVKNASGGHGGMDFLEDYRLIECLKKGEPTDMDVYDAAAWSVIVPLTCQSVANRSRPVDVPDFTRGSWRTKPPLKIIGG